MATNPRFTVPALSLEVENTPNNQIVHCTGKITSNTAESLKNVVKPLIAANVTIVEVRYANLSILSG